MLTQLIQTKTAVQDISTSLEKTQLLPSTLEKLPSQQPAKSEISIPNPFIFRITTARQRRTLNADAIRSTEKLVSEKPKAVSAEKHCKDKYSIPLNRKHHVSNLFFLD